LAPSSLLLFRVWLLLGLQSFGGGTATLFLIRQAVVEKHRWVPEPEFTRDWAICQIAPGINLLGLTILIGFRLARIRGIVVSLVGLLLPSVVITVVMTALYAEVKELDLVQAALRGIVPATVGLGLLLAIRMARPLLQESRLISHRSLLLSAMLLLASAASVTFTNLPVVAVLWAAGTISAVANWWWRRLPSPESPPA